MKTKVTYLLFILMAPILINSCTKKESDRLSVKDLEQLHQEVKQLINYELIVEAINHVEDNSIKKETPEQQEAWNLYLENVAYTNQYGVDALLRSKGYNDKVLNVILDLHNYKIQHGEIDENEYQYLIDHYNISREDFKLAFMGYEIYEIAKATLPQNRNCNLDDPWGCALAIAGTVATTLGAMTVTGGVGLVVFLASKAIATASVIHSCT